MEYSTQLMVPKIENPFGFDWLFHENPYENVLLDSPPVETLFEANYSLPWSYHYDQLPLIDFQNFEDFDGGFSFENAFSYCEYPMVDEKPQTNLVTNSNFNHNHETLTSDIGSEFSMLIEREMYDSLGNTIEENSTRCGKRKKKAVELELDEIQKYFGVPIKVAAKELKVGVTRLKKRCRELNITRWPHRKLKSLKYLLSNVKKMGLNSNEIMMLEEQQRLLEVAPDMELTEKAKKLRQACFKANYKSKRSLAAAPS